MRIGCAGGDPGMGMVEFGIGAGGVVLRGYIQVGAAVVAAEYTVGSTVEEMGWPGTGNGGAALREHMRVDVAVVALG